MTSNSFRCYLCQAALDELTIKRHISEFHLNYRPYDCTVCNRKGNSHKTSSEEAMEDHITIAHRDQNFEEYHVVKDKIKEAELKAAIAECRRSPLADTVMNKPLNSARYAPIPSHSRKLLGGVFTSPFVRPVYARGTTYGTGNVAISTAPITVTPVTKCAKFFTTLLHLSQRQSQSNTTATVRRLIRGVVFGNLSPENFMNQLQRALRSPDQKNLLTFLRDTLPALRTALRNREQVIEGIGTAEEYELENQDGSLDCNNDVIPATNVTVVDGQKQTAIQAVKETESTIPPVVSTCLPKIVTSQLSVVDAVTNSENSTAPNAIILIKTESPVSNVPVGIRLQTALSSFVPIDLDANEAFHERQKIFHKPSISRGKQCHMNDASRQSVGSPKTRRKEITTIEAKEMRGYARLGEKRKISENKFQKEPKAKKSQLDDRVPNIAAKNNETMMETFKFLNYCQLATSSLVSKRFWNLICTHRHSLALLYVNRISMNSYVANQRPAVINTFDKKLSAQAYSKWVNRNGYLKHVPLEGQIGGIESTENGSDIYEFSADVYHPNNYNHTATTVLYAQAELKDETWPVFQHFFRLLVDPFIYIRSLTLNSEKDVLSLLAEDKIPDYRLQCEHMNIRFNGETQKFIAWIKDHVRGDEFEIHIDSDTNYDDELLDFVMTGASCTSGIYVRNYDLSQLIVNLVQKFMGLKNRDDCQIVQHIKSVVESIGCNKVVQELKRDFAELIAEEKQYNEGRGTKEVIGFINDDIEKKLTICVRNVFYDSSTFSTEIINL